MKIIFSLLFQQHLEWVRYRWGLKPPVLACISNKTTTTDLDKSFIIIAILNFLFYIVLLGISLTFSPAFRHYLTFFSLHSSSTWLSMWWWVHFIESHEFATLSFQNSVIIHKLHMLWERAIKTYLYEQSIIL